VREPKELGDLSSPDEVLGVDLGSHGGNPTEGSSADGIAGIV
jgi:hypothetical protein